MSHKPGRMVFPWRSTTVASSIGTLLRGRPPGCGRRRSRPPSRSPERAQCRRSGRTRRREFAGASSRKMLRDVGQHRHLVAARACHQCGQGQLRALRALLEVANSASRHHARQSSRDQHKVPAPRSARHAVTLMAHGLHPFEPGRCSGAGSLLLPRGRSSASPAIRAPASNA